jgi:hypothetical protein
MDLFVFASLKPKSTKKCFNNFQGRPASHSGNWNSERGQRGQVPKVLNFYFSVIRAHGLYSSLIT